MANFFNWRALASILVVSLLFVGVVDYSMLTKRDIPKNLDCALKIELKHMKTLKATLESLLLGRDRNCVELFLSSNKHKIFNHDPDVVKFALIPFEFAPASHMVTINLNLGSVESIEISG